MWKQWQAAPDQALGYEKTTGRQAILRGLLHRAGGGAWDDQTVAMSMRETENEINLLVPADLRTPDFNEPPCGLRCRVVGDDAAGRRGGRRTRRRRARGQHPDRKGARDELRASTVGGSGPCARAT